MSEYLLSSDYTNYGLPAGTDAADVRSASALIDGYLERPEGLVWTPDVTGQPCFMAGATAMRTWKPALPIAPGSSVVVTLDSVPPASILGEAVVLDNASATVRETSVVTTINGADVTFDTIRYAHIAQAPIKSGLVIAERRNVGYQGPVAFLSRTPVARLLSIGSRWDRSSIREPSLSDDGAGYLAGFSSGIGVAPGFGAGPQWSLIDPTMVDCDVDTGKLNVRIMGARNEVRVCYLAGWAIDQLPEIIKQVTAKLTLAVANADPDLPANVKLYKAGDTAIQKFADSMFGEDMIRQLEPFKIVRGL